MNTIRRNDKNNTTWQDYLKLYKNKDNPIVVYNNKDGQVTTIRLPLDPTDWFVCCSREGEFYMGGCCGNMSYAQDILNEFFRESGWAKVDALREYVEAMRSHDGYDEQDLPDPESQAAEDPIARIIALWDRIKDNVAPPKKETPSTVDLTDPKEAVTILANNIWVLSWSFLFSDEDDHKKHDTIIRLSKILPALNTLSKHIRNLDLGPINAFAIYDKDLNLMKTRSGYAIYDNIEYAKKVITEYWQQDIKDFYIKEVILNIDDGIIINKE